MYPNILPCPYMGANATEILTSGFFLRIREYKLPKGNCVTEVLNKSSKVVSVKVVVENFCRES